MIELHRTYFSFRMQ